MTDESPAEQFIAQAIVRYHKGCAGGSAWVRWGLEAIARFHVSSNAVDPTAIEALRRSSTKWPDLLREPSPAADALLACGLIYGVAYVDAPGRFIGPAGDFPLGKEARIRNEAEVWTRYLSELIALFYGLAAPIRLAVTRAAAARGFTMPDAFDPSRPRTLIDAAEAILSLQQQFEQRKWPKVELRDVASAEAERAVDLLLLLRLETAPTATRKDASKWADWSERDAYVKGIARLSVGPNDHCDAMDGREFELAELGIAHTPRPASAARSRTRDEMIAAIQAYITGPPPRSPESKRARVAAGILLDIGDTKALESVVGWMADFPTRSANLFDEFAFDSRCYEIDRRGRRRDLLAVPSALALMEAPQPSSTARREPIEVFRPIGGPCRVCGGRLLALFDLAADAARPASLPTGVRVMLPFCPKCVENDSIYTASIRTDDRDPARFDVDAWTSPGPKENGFHLLCPDPRDDA